MYIVIEIQTWDTSAWIVNQYASKAEAESRFHQILAAAAVSEVPTHSALMIDEKGFPVRPPEYYTHTPVVAETPEDNED